MNENMSSEQNMPQNQPNNCNCRMCRMYGHGHRFFLLRIILGLIILGFVFCVGVKVGEFKNEFRGMRGQGHMRGGYQQMPMMRTFNMAAPSGMMQSSGTMMISPTTATTTPKK